MSKFNVEQVKVDSRGLRGTIPEDIAAGGATFAEENATLLKFHGV